MAALCGENERLRLTPDIDPYIDLRHRNERLRLTPDSPCRSDIVRLQSQAIPQKSALGNQIVMGMLACLRVFGCAPAVVTATANNRLRKPVCFNRNHGRAVCKEMC